MIEPCMRGVGAKAAAQITAITMDAIAKSEIHVLFAERTACGRRCRAAASVSMLFVAGISPRHETKFCSELRPRKQRASTERA